mmetsp:Transcript_42185/g.108656  ORF Transcript_42185/g.108656 Transcript_42185/m.108656 type:complete len:164 (-) Transcript_42185:79-570(-)
MSSLEGQQPIPSSHSQIKMGGGGEDKEEETDASRLDTAIVSKDLVRLCLELPPPSDSVHEDEKKVIGTGSYGVIYPHGPAQVVKVYKVCDEGLPSTSLDSCAEGEDLFPFGQAIHVTDRRTEMWTDPVFPLVFLVFLVFLLSFLFCWISGFQSIVSFPDSAFL